MSHKRRSSKLGKPETGRFCGCGKPCRPHTFFCGDACRFWSKVRRGPHCWEWTASRSGGTTRDRERIDGWYGQFTINKDGRQRHVGAHVFSYVLMNGPIEPGAFVLHRCDNPKCVRPDHLFLGDHKANMEDAVAKGRLRAPRPSKQRLSVADVTAIRSRVTSGEKRVRVAADFGITKAYVTRIMQGTARRYDAPLVPAVIEKAS